MIAAILVVPLLIVVLLSAPAWLVWPFLATDRRTSVLDFLDHILESIKVLAGVKAGQGVRRTLPPISSCGVVATADNGGPAMARRGVALLGMLLAGVALATLGAVFGAVGLAEASEISAVIGTLVGVAGLGLSAYGIRLARRPQPTGPGTTGPGSHAVSGSANVGNNIPDRQGL